MSFFVKLRDYSCNITALFSKSDCLQQLLLLREAIANNTRADCIKFKLLVSLIQCYKDIRILHFLNYTQYSVDILRPKIWIFKNFKTLLWLLFPNNRHTFFHFHCISVNFFRYQRQTCLLDLVCPWVNTYRHTIYIQEIQFYVVEVFGKSAVRSLSTEEGTLSLIKNHMSTVYTPSCTVCGTIHMLQFLP